LEIGYGDEVNNSIREVCTVNIDVLTSSDKACDEFVSSKPDGKIDHLYLWSDAVGRAAKLNHYYLVARESEQIRGVLPLIHAKSMLFGNTMVSQAFSDYGGILADSTESRDALFSYAIELATELGCESVEFRNIEPLPYDLQLRSGKMSMHLSLDADPEKVWKAFSCKVRNQVRKAEKSNVVVTEGTLDLLQRFYPVYATRMHQLGTPVYPRILLENLITAFPNNSRLFLVNVSDKTIGGALTFCYNGFAEIPFASILTEFNRLCPNNLLYWSVIKHYCLAGAKYFDFGRCTVDGPTHRFKKQWGPKPVNLNYQYWIQPGKDLTILSPDNPRFRKKVELWKKLPLWMANSVGPLISRKLP